METSPFLAPTRGEWVMLLRLVFAMLAGAVIGWNRHREGKPAGIGTHALVGLGQASSLLRRFSLGRTTSTP